VIVISSSHQISLLFFLELSIIGFLVMWWGDRRRSEVAIFFLIQIIRSLWIIFSSFYWIRVFSFSINFSIGLTFLIFGFFIKIGLFPFHFWLKIVTESIPYLVLGNFLTILKIGPLLILRSYFCNSNYAIMGLINVLVGVVKQISSSRLKLILVFSSVQNVGWIVFLMHFYSETFYFIFFLYVLIVLHACYEFIISGFDNIEELIISEGKYLLAIMFAFFSISGIPPFLGFYIKWVLIISCFSFHYAFF